MHFYSVSVEDPLLEEHKEYLQERDAVLKDHIGSASKVFTKGSTDRKTVIQQAFASGVLFADTDFLPSMDSLFKIDKLAAAKGEETSPTETGILPAIEWRRPSEFMDAVMEPKIFEGRIEAGDILQGQLGDCWLMCSIAAIAEFDVLVKDLISENECNPSMGLYVVKLCMDGEWKKILIDSYFPCVPKGGPIYSRSRRGELWVMLLEKAFAKYNGSYAAIRNGWSYEAMMDLTGAPFKEFNLEDDSCIKMIQDGTLWETLKQYDSLNYIATLSTPGADHLADGGSRSGGGLVPGYAYTLVGVQESEDGKIKLCKIRNPWGDFEWSGDWGNDSKLWTPELKQEFGWTGAQDGIFFMSFDYVVKHFHGINVCLLRKPGLNTVAWKEERKKIQYKFSHEAHGVESVQMFKLIIAGEGAELYATVHQQDKRRIGTPLYFDIGATILKETSVKGEYKFIGSSGNAVDRQHQLEITKGVISSGTYLLFPTSTGCKIENERKELAKKGKNVTPDDVTRPAMISVHCDKLFLIQEVPFDARAYEQAVKMPVMAQGEQTDLFNDGSVILYTLKSGYNGNSYVAENKKTDMYAKLEMDFSKSSNIVTEDGDLVASVLIPPGESKVIHHVMPADDHMEWTCSWNVSGEMLSESDVRARKI